MQRLSSNKTINKSNKNILCYVTHNDIKKSFSFKKNMTIKEIKNIIIQKFENNEYNEIKSEDILIRSSTTKNRINSSNKSLEKIIDKNNNSRNKSKVINKNKDNKSKNIHKKANLYYKGKELVNDDQIIDNLVLNSRSEAIEFSVIILSLNESTFIDENKTKEKLIQNISEECPFHKDEKELYICVNCKVSFCKHCLSMHESHEIIEKKNLIRFKEELIILDRELSQSLSETNLSSIYELKNSNDNICKYNNILDKLQNRLDNVKKLHKGIINNYKKDVEKMLPYLLEYKEKIEQMIETSYQLDTMKNGQDFLDYYYWFVNIKKKKSKINQEIQNLKKKKHVFNELMEEFDEKIKKILIKTEDDYQTLKNYYYNYNNRYDSENQFRKGSFSTSLNQTILSSSSSIKNNNTPLKLNLFSLLNSNTVNYDILQSMRSKRSSLDISHLKENFVNYNNKDNLSNIKCISNSLFSPKNKNIKYKPIIENENGHVIKRHLSHSRFVNKRPDIFEKIDEKTEIEESLEEIDYPKLIYNIKPRTKTIYVFNFETKKINEIQLNLKNLSINCFELFHGLLSYKNNFYISGGNDSPTLFCKYFYKDNNKNITPLKELPSGHSFHGMLGIKSNIYIISGLNSKKVERYNILENSWEKLEDLNEYRIWPNCLDYRNRYIYVFNGLCKNNNEKNILIERFDINNIYSKWELLLLNNNSKIKLPSNLGGINIDDNYFLFIGGKNHSKENPNNECFKYSIENKTIEKDIDYKFLQNEEFNGKVFSNFGNYYYGEFSSNNNKKLYLINAFKKTIEEINCNDVNH